MFDRRQIMTTLLSAFSLGKLESVAAAAAADAAQPITCNLVTEAASGRILYRDGPCEQRFSPCSTFKIPLAVMGFDAGLLTDSHAPRWDRPAGAQGRPDAPEKGVDPTIWQRESIVWYSQELTRRLGMARFQAYLRAFGYGNEDLSGNPGRNDGLSQAWLVSSLLVSPDEQVEFLRRLLGRSLPASAQAQEMAMAILPTFPAEGGWTVHGKTGSGWLRDARYVIDRTRPLGWFIGWAEKEGRRVIFARLEVGIERYETPSGFRARAAVLADLHRMVRG